MRQVDAFARLSRAALQLVRRFAMNTSVAGFTAALLLGAGAVLAADQAPNDAQIAAIVVTANQVDIDAGKLAASKASAAKVKDFAQLMVTDHTGVNQAATELVSKLHVTPQPNAISESLKKGGDEKLAALRKLSGSAFDVAYVDNEVAYHQAVLDAMDKTLIPNAKNAELEALLIKVRPAFVAHLDHAKQLQSALRKSGE
jgi:putative membrane protein